MNARECLANVDCKDVAGGCSSTPLLRSSERDVVFVPVLNARASAGLRNDMPYELLSRSFAAWELRRDVAFVETEFRYRNSAVVDQNFRLRF